jgi:molybdenum cofactor cytidylyltransferase
VTPTVAVLAAGAGTRFADTGGDGHKLLADIGGAPLVIRTVEAAVTAGIGDVVVVTGAVDLGDVLADLPVRLVANDRWGEGLATSLQVAVAVARADGSSSLVVGLGDQPGVTPGAWRAVAEHAPDAPIVVASYGGRRGNPVRLHGAVWHLLPTTGDEGGRALIRRRPDLVTEVACDGDPHDVDTREDLDRWN